MTTTGLIGHSGFVGGTLARAARWGECYNSKNIDDIRGREFDLLVCAGVPAVKWLANQKPEADRAGIARLTDALSEVQARETVLISTIDVYPDPGIGGDEDAAIEPEANHPYGRHRFELERWMSNRLPSLRIVRLPALFGSGLRKNVIYDLLTNNMVGAINPASAFQWYPLERLWHDIGVVRAANLSLVNLFPPPLPTAHIIDRLFPGAQVGAARLPAPSYDMRTRHGRAFGSDGPYLTDAETVFLALSRFVEGARAS